MRKVLFLSLLCLALGGCSVGVSSNENLTPSLPPFFTATLMPTFTPRPSATPAPPTVAPTIAPLEGIAKSQINVRAAPDQNQASLGLLNYLSKLEIIGKDASGKWWQIIYKDSPTGVGWVTAAFVDFKGDADKVPVVEAPVLTAPAAGTDAAPGTSVVTPAPTSGARTAVVTQNINVRSGPATANTSLGMLDPNTTVTLTGRNEINTWVQIEYPAGPDGKGWVAALYLKDPNLNGLPYYDNQGKLIYAPTQGVDPGQPTLTPTPLAEAAPDGDSEEAPAVHQIFSPDAASVLTYSSELSAPTGDGADWVDFTPYGPANQSTYLYMRLDCTGNGGVTATLEKDGKPVADSPQLVCGIYGLAMKVLGSQEYMLVLRADPSGGPLRYVKYTLTIKVTP